MIEKNNTITEGKLLYGSPQTEVVFVKMQSILCISNPDANATEMTEGDDNW